MKKEPEIVQLEGPDGKHTYVILDEKGNVIKTLSGITERGFAYFSTYPETSKKLSKYSIQDIQRWMQGDNQAVFTGVEERGVKLRTPKGTKEESQSIWKDKKFFPIYRYEHKSGEYVIKHKTGATLEEARDYVRQQKAIEEGSIAHAELEQWIKSNCTLIPKTERARKLAYALETAYPRSEGYEYQSEVLVSDFKKYATSIDLIITNKHTKEVVIADFKTGSKHLPPHTAQVSLEGQMLAKTKGVNATGYSIIYPDGAINVSPFEKSYLQNVYYSGNNILNKQKPLVQDDLEYQQATTGVQWIKNMGFKSVNNKDPYAPRDVVILDVETTGVNNTPISIAAIKTRFNLKTKKLDVVDVYERYYNIKDEGYGKNLATQSVHKLSNRIVNKLRRQQNEKYGRYFNDTEKRKLKSFLRDSVIAGHNVADFDLPLALGLNKSEFYNDIMDTLIASENIQGIYNMWSERISHKLGDVYEHYTGQKPKIAHNAFADVLTNMTVLERQLLENEYMRLMLYKKGFSLGPVDSYFGDQLMMTGEYDARLAYEDARKLYTVEDLDKMKDLIDDMIAHDMLIPDDDGDGMKIADNIHVTDMRTGASSVKDLNDMKGAPTEAMALGTFLNSSMKELAEAMSDFKDSFAGLKAFKKSSLVNTVAGLPESDRKAFVEELGFIGGDATSILGAARIKANAKEATAWNNANKDVSNAIKFGDITSKQAEIMRKDAKSAQELNDALENQIRTNDRLKKGLGNIRMYDLNEIFSSVKGEWAGIKGAARGVIPSWFARPIGRFGDAAMNVLNRQQAAWNAGSNIAGMVGGTIGTFINPGVGTMIGAATFKAISQVVGNIANAGIIRRGERIQESLNIWGGLADIVMTPMRLLGNIIRKLLGLFGALAGAITAGINSMKSLATPLSHLTGVSFPMQQGLEAAGTWTGLGKGAYGNAYNDFANQSQGLFTTGALNRDRLIASAMLGVFGDVYNPTADSDEMYGNTVNALLAQMNGKNDKRVMALAGRIDSSLPQTLQVMKDLGYNDWNRMKTYSGTKNNVFFRAHSQGERNTYRRQSFEFQGNLESMMNSLRRITSRLWEVVGAPLMGSLNRMLDGLAVIVQGVKTPAEALDLVKGKLKEGWKAIKETFNIDLVGSLITGLKRIAPIIIDVMTEIAKASVRIWSSVLKTVLEKGDALIAYMNTIHIDWKKIMSGDWENAIQIGAPRSKQGKNVMFTSYRAERDDYLTFRNRNGKETIVGEYDQYGNTVSYSKADFIRNLLSVSAAGGHFEANIEGYRVPLQSSSREEAEYLFDAYTNYRKGKYSAKAFVGDMMYMHPDFLKSQSVEGQAALRRLDEKLGLSPLSRSLVGLSERAEDILIPTINAVGSATKKVIGEIDLNIGDKTMGRLSWSEEGASYVPITTRADITGTKFDVRAVAKAHMVDKAKDFGG